MLLVILGAGASYDSAPSQPPNDGNYSNLADRPPLANELFGNRKYFGEVMNKYHRCIPIITRLRHNSDRSPVELELQALQASATAYPERHRQLAAVRYYLQDILWHCTENWLRWTQNISNHRTLVDDIRRWQKPDEKVCFVTFNYDTLLEEALRYADYPFTELSAYIARDLMLVKLHGSVNWARIVNTPVDELLGLERTDLAKQLIDRYQKLDISKQFVMVGEYPPSPRNKKAVFPALAIPVEAKLDFECPPEHIEALKAFIPEVRKILMIGWRATEQPFLDLLKRGLGQANPHIMVVNGATTEGEAAATNVRRSGIPARYTIVDGGFTQFTVRGAGTEFLSG
jgi:hypothetical protein